MATIALLFSAIFFGNAHASDTLKFCDIARDCNWVTSERERIECIGEIMFRATPDPNRPDRGVVYHENGQGWGNAFNGISTMFPYASGLGRRFVVNIPYYLEVFLPPEGGESAWYV